MKLTNLYKASAALGLCAAAVVASAFPLRLATAGTDEANAVAVFNASGEFYVVGTAYINPALLNDIVVTKYSPGGAVMWVRNFGGPDNDVARDVEMNQATGELYVVGAVRPLLGGDSDAVVLQLDAGGLLLNSAFYGGPAGLDDGATQVVISPAGTVLVGGHTRVAPGDRDFLVINYTPGLAAMWTTVWSPGYGDDELNDLAYGPFNSVYLGGTVTNPAGDTDGVLVRLSPAGAVVNRRITAGIAGMNDETNSIAVDFKGQVYAASTQSAPGGDRQMRIDKWSPNLAILRWTNAFNGMAGVNDDFVVDMELGGPGVVVGGASKNIFSPHYEFTLLALNPGSGAMRPGWPQFYHFAMHDVITDVAIDPAGNVVATGWSDGAIGNDYATVKFNTAGTMLWSSRYDNAVLNDEPAEVAIGAGMMPIVTGRSAGAGTGWDWATVRLNPGTGAIL